MTTAQQQELTWQQMRDQAVEAARRDRLRPKTDNQGRYLEAMEKAAITVCTGPAGTGKTYMACGFAANLLRDGKVKKIVLTRPMVTCSGRQGKGMGFLPGDQNQKFAPYLRPLLDAFADFFDPAELERLVAAETIEMWPLDLMRGASIKGAVVICDEAQNCEFEQLYMLLTRIDAGTRIIVTGDTTRKQTDLRLPGKNPLAEVVDRFRPDCDPEVALVSLGREDIVRSRLVRWVDERLSGEPEVAQGEAWFDLKCPKCRATLWYEDRDPEADEVEQVRCFRCGAVVELWTEAGEFRPATVAPELRRGGCADTFPEKP